MPNPAKTKVDTRQNPGTKVRNLEGVGGAKIGESRPKQAIMSWDLGTANFI